MPTQSNCSLATAVAILLLAGCAAHGTDLPPNANSSRALHPAAATAAAGGCQFRSAPKPVQVAFCETFDHPAGIGNRSGDLNGTLWNLIVAWSAARISRRLAGSGAFKIWFNRCVGGIFVLVGIRLVLERR